MLSLGKTLAFSGEMSVGTTLTSFLHHLNYWQFSWSDVLPQEMQSCKIRPFGQVHIFGSSTTCLAIPLVPIICSKGTHFLCRLNCHRNRHTSHLFIVRVYNCLKIWKHVSNCYDIFQVVNICRMDVLGLIYMARSVVKLLCILVAHNSCKQNSYHLNCR